MAINEDYSFQKEKSNLSLDKFNERVKKIHLIRFVHEKGKANGPNTRNTPHL